MTTLNDLTTYNVIDLLDTVVQVIAERNWANDGCPPEFWVSLDNDNMDNQVIMISINHLGSKFTEKLFPRPNTLYGYNTIFDQMVSLYNRTM